MLAKYSLFALINPLTIIWFLALTMQILDISVNDEAWYSFPLLITNLGIFILSCIASFHLIILIFEQKEKQ